MTIQYTRQTKNDAVKSLALLSFLSFSALSFAAPFINLYMKDSGLSATNIGILISLGAFLELTLNPIINSWADRHQRHLWVLRAQMALMALATLIFSVTALPLWLGVAFLLNAVNGRGANEMLSQLTMTRLEEFKLRIFGKVRVWGSLGWALGSILTSPLIAAGGYIFTFIASTVMRLSVLIVTRALPTSTDKERADTYQAPLNKAIYVLMASQFIFFMGLNAFSSFVWIHFRENLGVPPEHIGFLAAVFAITEFAPMLFVDRFIDRFGVRNVVIFGMVGMAIEWYLYGILLSPAWVVVIAIARAWPFTMYVIGMTVMISEISSRKRVATNRALIQITMPALSMLLTSPIAGWIYDEHGASALFTTSAVMGVIACLMMLSQYKRLRPVPLAESLEADPIEV